MKACTKCGRTLDLDQFYRSKAGKSGRASECKDCFNSRNQARHRCSPRARAKVLVSHAQTRAAKKGLAFDLSIEWAASAIAEGRCQTTGLPFDLSLTGERNLYGPSLDRVDPSQGYTKENTRVVLFGYNACKNTASSGEVRSFILELAEALR